VVDGVDELLVASRAMLGVVARSIAPALDRVSLPQFRLLVVLTSAGPMRMGLLADRAGLSAPSTSRMVDRLEQQALARREPSPQSGREVTVAATEAGAALVREVTLARRRELCLVLETLPEDERAQVVRAFAAFARAMGEAPLEDLLTLGI